MYLAEKRKREERSGRKHCGIADRRVAGGKICGWPWVYDETRRVGERGPH
jgi:hypothetical protein